MDINIYPQAVAGLPEAEQAMLQKLTEILTLHGGTNDTKERYYEGDIPLAEVNLGIALPEGMQGLQIGCAWGAKTVDVLAARSMFDGFVGADGDDVPELHELVTSNRLLAEYPKAARDELKFGCTFATLSTDEERRPRIRWHSPRSAAALWDGEKGRIGCGMAVIDTAPDNSSDTTWRPTHINLYTDKAIWVLRRTDSAWTAKAYGHKLGRPPMEPLIWNATSAKPFGRSRINWPVRRLIQGFVRTVANATIGLEFATTPQKYLLGVTEEQFNAVTDRKFKQYVGSILAATSNPETGEKPEFGQLTQGSITPHVDMLRILATQFSAATGLTVTDTGVVNDANPTSSDAILAQSKTLVTLAEELNTGNGEALKTIALMALAIGRGTSVEELPDDLRSIMAHFKNPAMPNVAVTADAAMKIATARPAFANTDTFLEMLGFDAASIRRIKGQEQRTRGLEFFAEIDGADEADEGEIDDTVPQSLD